MVQAGDAGEVKQAATGGSPSSRSALRPAGSRPPRSCYAARPRPGIAIVVIHHLDPTHESSLVEILSRATAMPV